MINTSFLLGYPVEFKNLCLVYPPKVKDVAANPKYMVLYKLLTITQEEIEDEINEKLGDNTFTLTPFEYILNNAYHSAQFKELVEEAFQLYIHESVKLLPMEKQIIIGDLVKTETAQAIRILTEADYFDFQNLVREACGDKSIEPYRVDEDPRVRRIKAKARYREKIKAKQGKGLNLTTLIASISCMGFGINPLNIGELSYAALPLLLRTYEEKEHYELDVRSLLAGADSKKIKPKYWIRNLDE